MNRLKHGEMRVRGDICIQVVEVFQVYERETVFIA